MLIHIYESFPRWNCSSYIEVHRRLGEMEKEAAHSIMIVGSFKKQENLRMGITLGVWKTSRSLHLPTRILKVYLELYTEFSQYTDQMVSTAHYSLKVVSLKTTPIVWKDMKSKLSKGQEVGEECVIAQVQRLGQQAVTSCWWSA